MEKKDLKNTKACLDEEGEWHREDGECQKFMQKYRQEGASNFNEILKHLSQIPFYFFVFAIWIVCYIPTFTMLRSNIACDVT